MEIKPTRISIAEGLAQRTALVDLVEAARRYTAAREACPIGDWQSRIEESGWTLAQATRAYDRACAVAAA